MKRCIYAYLSGLSFIIAGNLGESHAGWWGWWDVPSFAFVLIGLALMEAHSKEPRA